jgi:prepilin-type processing-associated H-X9-DG protein
VFFAAAEHGRRRFESSKNSHRESLVCLRGFTLVELLAIVSVLVMVGIAISSSLAGTKPASAGFVCMNNLRQLGSAWKMYADDFGGNLVYNHDAPQNSPGHESWVGGWLDYSATNPDNTNTALLVNHSLYPHGAYLGAYLSDAALFRCPADASVVTIAGRTAHRVRSYSMNNTFGQGSRSWSGSSKFTQHVKLNDVRHPSKLFVLIEENNASINDGCFFVDTDVLWQMVDFPAAYHNSGCNLVFVDGHTEQHRWTDRRTTPVVPPGTLMPLNINFPVDLDIQWLQQHTSELP